MTREDYMLLYLEDYTSFVDYVYWEVIEPCPILRELLLDLGDTFLASCYVLHFRIKYDPKLKKLIYSDPLIAKCEFKYKWNLDAAAFEIFIMNRV